MFGMGMQELLILFVIVLLLFGPKRLPDLARSLGQSLTEFKSAMRGEGAAKMSESASGTQDTKIQA